MEHPESGVARTLSCLSTQFNWLFIFRLQSIDLHRTCSLSFVLLRLASQTVFEKFADFRFKRIVCVDHESRCKGIISVSDLLAYFL